MATTTDRALYEFPTYPSVTIPSDRIIRRRSWGERWEVVDPASGETVAELYGGARAGTWVLWPPRALREAPEYRGRSRGHLVSHTDAKRSFPEVLEDWRDSSD